jgi:hypothetical protein
LQQKPSALLNPDPDPDSYRDRDRDQDEKKPLRSLRFKIPAYPYDNGIAV